VRAAWRSAALLVAMMIVASVVLWVGIPVAWLWIGSQIQGATSNLGASMGAMLFGSITSIALMIPVLGRLSEAYRASRVARGREDTGNFALETVLVITALVALVGFAAWFFLFAGTAPLPIVPES
jgi:hypothetical protein